MSKDISFFKAPRYLFRKHNILAFLRKLDFKTFIDIGCGAGELACSLAERDKKGIAIDSSSEAIAVANKMRDLRKITKTLLTFTAGNMDALGNNKSDLVICCEVLEHVKNDGKFLKELVKHSNKYILLSVPAKQSLYDASDKSVGHYRRYNKPDLIKLLNNCDLNIIKFANYGYPFTDIIRIARKTAFQSRLNKNKSNSMAERSKDSGINPIKISKRLAKIDIEKAIIPFYYFSLIFNRFDLSEGYLVLCEKK